MYQNLIRVFVYGTLKTNEPNAHIMRDTVGVQHLIGYGKTNRLFPLIISSKYNIPFLLMDPGRGYIIMDNGDTTLAWVYMLPHWRPDIEESSTPLLENYSSKGSHGREYIASENVKSEEDLWA
uniref:Gamma-glutamylcyclotransferase family protein n=1 Tax=Heterorhabditis bacteriophora TaxID=37862 RepID=A0A1I7XGY1_HETBA